MGSCEIEQRPGFVRDCESFSSTKVQESSSILVR
jgi:hypothetical protein